MFEKWYPPTLQGICYAGRDLAMVPHDFGNDIVVPVVQEAFARSDAVHEARKTFHSQFQGRSILCWRAASFLC